MTPLASPPILPQLQSQEHGFLQSHANKTGVFDNKILISRLLEKKPSRSCPVDEDPSWSFAQYLNNTDDVTATFFPTERYALWSSSSVPWLGPSTGHSSRAPALGITMSHHYGIPTTFSTCFPCGQTVFLHKRTFSIWGIPAREWENFFFAVDVLVHCQGC
jgi:hypothetical protein